MDQKKSQAKKLLDKWHKRPNNWKVGLLLTKKTNEYSLPKKWLE
jgi:hypothetical protein